LTLDLRAIGEKAYGTLPPKGHQFTPENTTRERTEGVQDLLSSSRCPGSGNGLDDRGEQLPSRYADKHENSGNHADRSKRMPISLFEKPLSEIESAKKRVKKTNTDGS